MAIFLQRNISPVEHLGIWKINESIEDLLISLHLNQHELEVYRKINNDLRRSQWLSTRVLLRHLGKDNELGIGYDEFGKPFLNTTDQKISISHSSDFVAIIINETKETGIDIERIVPKIERVAHKFMSTQELASLNEKSLEELYIYWGAKEALYKLHGKKNLIFKENISIEPFVYQRKGIISGKINTNFYSESFKLEYERINEFMLVYVMNP